MDIQILISDFLATFDWQFFLTILLTTGLFCYLLFRFQLNKIRLKFEARLAQLEKENRILEKNHALLEQQEKFLLNQQGEKQQQYEQQLQQLNENVRLVHNENKELTEALHDSDKQIQSFKIENQKEREYNNEKLKEIEKNRKQLITDFEHLATKVLQNSQHQFSEQSKQGLDLFLKPFRQQVGDFKSRVEEIHSKDLTQRAELKSELKQLHQLNQQMTNEAHQLATALKGQKKTQGNWGELILENVLDRSGLQPGKDYSRETSFNTEDGRRRPDVIIHLPDNKHLVVDAKVSLNAYTRYVNSEDPEERQQAIKEHINALSDRMNDLSSKNYFDLPGLNSPEMVFMFVPIESAFVEAIKFDETLFHKAIEQRVLITTPTTLLTSLNIVRQLWRLEDQTKHTAKLAEQAQKVYNQLRLFLENMELLGVQLDKSRQTYDKAMNQFVSGRGNLVKRVGDFKKLGVSVQKEISARLLEQGDMEITLGDSSTENKKN